MFPANKAMNISTDTRGHDRGSFIYLPFTVEEEVTFCEAEDVSAEKGKEEDARRRLRAACHAACYCCYWMWCQVHLMEVWIVWPYDARVPHLAAHTESVHFGNCQKFCKARMSHSVKGV